MLCVVCGVCCLPFVVTWLMYVVCCLLSVRYSLLRGGCRVLHVLRQLLSCLLCAVCHWLSVLEWSLCVVWCLLVVVRCGVCVCCIVCSFAVCWLLFVVCCVVWGAYVSLVARCMVFNVLFVLGWVVVVVICVLVVACRVLYVVLCGV